MLLPRVREHPAVCVYSYNSDCFGACQPPVQTNIAVLPLGGVAVLPHKRRERREENKREKRYQKKRDAVLTLYKILENRAGQGKEKRSGSRAGKLPYLPQDRPVKEPRESSHLIPLQCLHNASVASPDALGVLGVGKQ